MTERELKFQVPHACRDALRARLSALPAPHRRRLVSIYVDTADGCLARHRVALRLRHDGERWEQTLKAAGDAPVDRLEENVERPGDWPPDGPPIDPSLHAGTPAFDRLRAALADSAEPTLGAVFVSDFVRLHADLIVDDARIEIAFDEGELRAEPRGASPHEAAANGTGVPTLPIRELELELKSGPSRALFAAAADWADRHQLSIDTISKAARGERLARGRLDAPQATRARIVEFERGQRPDGRTLLRRWTAVCLEQVLDNASLLAAGEAPADVEVVHQLRVGLRRLRSVWRELGRCAGTDIDWQPAAGELFDALGRLRDRDAAVARFAAAIAAAGGRPLDPDEQASGPDLRERIAARPFQHAMLSLLAFALEDDDAGARAGGGGGGSGGGGGGGGDRDGIGLVVRRLRKLHRGLRRAARRFDELSDDDRHRVRKRAKRLRYLAELARPLLSPDDADALLKRLGRAQRRFGDYQDLRTAVDAYRDAARGGRHDAWFGVGWLQAQRPRHIARCHDALRRLARARLLSAAR
ncbi:MAG: CHAD domain-containing protein [Burkholderiaceae bacterium]